MNLIPFIEISQALFLKKATNKAKPYKKLNQYLRSVNLLNIYTPWCVKSYHRVRDGS